MINYSIIEMNNEIWKPIINYNLYEISNIGNIRNSNTKQLLKQTIKKLKNILK